MSPCVRRLLLAMLWVVTPSMMASSILAVRGLLGTAHFQKVDQRFRQRAGEQLVSDPNFEGAAASGCAKMECGGARA
jgi:hypothetical protein